MAKQLSSLDMHFLVKELKEMEGSRADQIYNYGHEEIYIQLHKSNVGKKILRAIIGKIIFITETKIIDETPSGFCMLLRKHLEGKFLDSIQQLESERILKFSFSSKDEKKSLYLEFLGKGNAVLCNSEDIILDCIIRHQFKDRNLAAKEKYKYPHMGYNLFELNEDMLADLLKKSGKDKIITCLATELGLGGTYSEEICLLAGIDKNTAPKNIDSKGISKILSLLKKLIGSKISPSIVYKDKEAIDVVPIGMEFYRNNEKKGFTSFNHALDEYFSSGLNFAKRKESPYTKKIEELKRIIGEQEISLKGLKEAEEEARNKGELIYTKYQVIQEILSEINKAKEKYSWEEIKSKLKGHKIVKDVDVKDKKVVVEV